MESLGEVAAFEGWSTSCTQELFLLMPLMPEDSERVRIVSQKDELPRTAFTVLDP